MFIKNKTKIVHRMSEKLAILESCCLRPILRVLEELRVRRVRYSLSNVSYYE